MAWALGCIAFGRSLVCGLPIGQRCHEAPDSSWLKLGLVHSTVLYVLRFHLRFHSFKCLFIDSHHIQNNISVGKTLTEVHQWSFCTVLSLIKFIFFTLDPGAPGWPGEPSLPIKPYILSGNCKSNLEKNIKKQSINFQVIQSHNN